MTFLTYMDCADYNNSGGLPFHGVLGGLTPANNTPSIL